MSFKAVQNKIAKKEGVGSKAAGAILASATRKASPAAKKKNPALKRVKMASGGAVSNRKALSPSRGGGVMSKECC